MGVTNLVPGRLTFYHVFVLLRHLDSIVYHAHNVVFVRHGKACP